MKMSCILLTSNHINAIACSIVDAINAKQLFNYQLLNGKIKASLYQHLIDCGLNNSIYLDKQLVYKKLAEINITAYNYRYNEEITFEELPEPQNQNHLSKPLKLQDSHFILEKSCYEWAKLLDSYLYQCSEDVTYNNPIIQDLEKLRNDYYSWLVTNTEEYEQADWVKSERNTPEETYIVYLREWYAYNRFGQLCKMPIEVYTEMFKGSTKEWQNKLKQSKELVKSCTRFYSEMLISKSELITDEYKSSTTYFYYDNEAEAREKYDELCDYMEGINNEPYYLCNR